MISTGHLWTVPSEEPGTDTGEWRSKRRCAIKRREDPTLDLIRSSPLHPLSILPSTPRTCYQIKFSYHEDAEPLRRSRWHVIVSTAPRTCCWLRIWRCLSYCQSSRILKRQGETKRVPRTRLQGRKEQARRRSHRYRRARWILCVMNFFSSASRGINNSVPVFVPSAAVLVLTGVFCSPFRRCSTCACGTQVHKSHVEALLTPERAEAVKLDF